MQTPLLVLLDFPEVGLDCYASTAPARKDPKRVLDFD